MVLRYRRPIACLPSSPLIGAKRSATPVPMPMPAATKATSRATLFSSPSLLLLMFKLLVVVFVADDPLGFPGGQWLSGGKLNCSTPRFTLGHLENGWRVGVVSKPEHAFDNGFRPISSLQDRDPTRRPSRVAAQLPSEPAL